MSDDANRGVEQMRLDPLVSPTQSLLLSPEHIRVGDTSALSSPLIECDESVSDPEEITDHDGSCLSVTDLTPPCSIQSINLLHDRELLRSHLQEYSNLEIVDVECFECKNNLNHPVKMHFCRECGIYACDSCYSLDKMPCHDDICNTPNFVFVT